MGIITSTLTRVPRILTFALIAVVLVVLDQFTKFSAFAAFHVGENLTNTSSIEIIPGIVDFTYATNTGAAFGFWQDSSDFFVGLATAFVIAALLYVIFAPRCGVLRTVAIAMVTAGAAGNTIDRLLNGYVIDFIHLQFISFPIFNLADTCLTIGCVLLIIAVLAKQ